MIHNEGLLIHQRLTVTLVNFSNALINDSVTEPKHVGAV